MVVNGGCFHSLVIPYNNNVDLTNCSDMAGKAVLICRANSHPFVDRTLSLENPVKIGRSVARARAAQSNGIFDCKVLSRNHALIWYTNGKFFLQDTKSSNGTFINNQRLSKSGEESLPREVSSGDIVQFGVDVLENARKVTHGCIIANLKLYLPDGKEAKANLPSSVLSGVGSVSVEDLYQLNQYIQEALQREQMLRNKLSSLQQVVMSLRQAVDLGWKALIAEDRLLSRVEILENQLQTYAKNFAEDKLREELIKLQEDKSVYQGLAKECLQKVLQEKLEVVQKCQDIDRSLQNAETECANFKEIMERGHEELQELALKHNAQVLKTVELQNKLQDAEEQNKDALVRLEAENEELSNEVKRLLANEAVMHEKIQQLEASGETVGRQLLSIQSQFQFIRSPDIHNHLSSLKERNGITEDVICKNNDEELKDENQKDVTNAVETLRNRLTTAMNEQKKTKEVVDLIEAQSALLQNEKMAKLQQINSLEAELEVHVDKLSKYTEEKRQLEQTLFTSEQSLKEESLNTPDTTTRSIDRKCSNWRSIEAHTSKMESLQSQIEDLKDPAGTSTVKDSPISVIESDVFTQLQTHSYNKTTAFAHFISADLHCWRKSPDPTILAGWMDKPKKDYRFTKYIYLDYFKEGGVIFSIITKRKYFQPENLDYLNLAFEEFTNSFKQSQKILRSPLENLICCPGYGFTSNTFLLEHFMNKIFEFQLSTKAKITILISEEVCYNLPRHELMKNMKLLIYKNYNISPQHDIPDLNMSQSLSASSANTASPLQSTTPNPSSQADVSSAYETIKESRSKMDAMERTIDLLEMDLTNAKKSLNEITKNWILHEEKLQEARKLKEEAEAAVNALREQLKISESSMLHLKLQEKFEIESEHINKHKEEATLLRKQLQEAQQTAKQSKNEAEMAKEKLRALSEELEITKSMAEKNNAATEAQLDNRAVEELSGARLEAASLQTQVLELESQIKKLKLESTQKQQEISENNGAETISMTYDEEFVDQLNLRIREMEEELVIVKEKYMAFNEKNIELQKELSNLKQDYEAVIHQPFFNVVFVLPLLVLFIAMTIAFHPTLAQLMGTSDSSRPDS